MRLVITFSAVAALAGLLYLGSPLRGADDPIEDLRRDQSAIRTSAAASNAVACPTAGTCAGAAGISNASPPGAFKPVRTEVAVTGGGWSMRKRWMTPVLSSEK